jgi:hypothetical protein
MMDRRKDMEAFLCMMDEYHRTIAYRGLPARLRASGRWFQRRACSSGYDSARQWKRKHRPTAHECYYNAQSFCLDHESARYFEGYVVFAGLHVPAEHAWVAMTDGKVVDFTLEAAEQIGKRNGLPCDTRDALYVGLDIPTEFIRERVLTSDTFGALADDYFAV